MKAITIKQQLKNLNSKLFTDSVGAIRIFNNLPSTFFSPTYNTGQRTDMYQTLSNAIHEADGFFDVVTPAYDSNTQKLGALFFDVNQFTYPVIALTQQEIDDKVAQEEDATAESEVNVKETDGQSEIRYIFRILKKLHNKGTLTNNQYNQSRALMFDALLPLYFGQWEISQTKLNAIVNPANATLLNILNQIRARITFYVTNGTRQDE